MNEVAMTIATREARDACRGEPDVGERVKKAMRACRGHWLVTDERQQLNSALVADEVETEGGDLIPIMKLWKETQQEEKP